MGIEVVFLLAGIGGSLLIALWQNRRAARAENALRDFLHVELPRKVAEEFGRVAASSEHPALPVPGEPATIPESAMSEAPNQYIQRVLYEDVDGDGRAELLVSYITGAHASGLRVFQWSNFEFRLLGELWSGSPSDYEVGDFDVDGRNEVRFWRSDQRALDLAYAFQPAERVTVRWENGDFVEVKVEPELSQDDVERLLEAHRIDSDVGID